MDQALLRYNTSLTVTLDVLAVRGAAEPDKVSKFPNLVFEFLDGSIAEQVKAGRREITIQFHVMTAAQRRQVVAWWLDPLRTIESTLTKASEPTATLSGTGLTGTYRYKIVAIDVIGQSEASDYLEISPSDQAVNLAWAGSTGARMYKILRSDDGGTTYDLKDYTTGLAYTDDSTAVIWEDIAVPAGADAINLIVPGDLEFQWDGTELVRLLEVTGRDATVFPRTSPFPV